MRDIVPRSPVLLRKQTGRVNWPPVRVLLLLLSALLGGCGLTETGAAAAGSAAAGAQQAAQARQTEERVRQQIETTNQEAVDRERAAADAASK